MMKYQVKVYFMDCGIEPKTFESNCHPQIREGFHLTQIFTNDCDVIYIRTILIERIEISKVS
jgi:hypothetical protein